MAFLWRIVLVGIILCANESSGENYNYMHIFGGCVRGSTFKTVFLPAYFYSTYYVLTR